jgi:hypothetical protein
LIVHMIKVRRNARLRPQVMSVDGSVYRSTAEACAVQSVTVCHVLSSKFPDVNPAVFLTLLTNHQNNPEKVEEFLLYYGWKGDGLSWAASNQRVTGVDIHKF